MGGSSVYFIGLNNDESIEDINIKIQAISDAIGINSFVKNGDSVAIKTHFGERGNTTHISPKLIKTIVGIVKKSKGKPYLTETSVLYRSSRSNALDHILLAYEHGFGFSEIGAPIIMSDGLQGNWEREVKIEGEIYKSVFVAGDSLSADKTIIVSHPTGHIIAGLGAAIKNLGMGLSSRKGKLAQHSDVGPIIESAKCTACGLCIKWCPEDAIVINEGKAKILNDKCIGCGECLTLCKFGAVNNGWDTKSDMLQKKMAEHAFAIHNTLKGKIIYFNFLINMTKNCDCMTSPGKLIDDIGIMCSFDPVALDTATLEITAKRNGDDLSRLSYPEHNPYLQIDHAVKLGMGSKVYKLIEVGF